MTKDLFHTTKHLLCLVLFMSTMVVEGCFAQFIKIDVTVQAQLEITMISDNNHPEHHIRDNSSKAKQKTQEFTWFEIRSRENIIVEVELLFTDKGMSQADSYYINTGYFDKAKADNFGNKPHGFPINNNNANNKDINNSQYYSSTNKYQCWIGIPGQSPVELNIAYN